MVKFAVEFWWKMLLTIFPNKRSSKTSFQTSPEVRHQFRRKLRQFHSGNRWCLRLSAFARVCAWLSAFRVPFQRARHLRLGCACARLFGLGCVLKRLFPKDPAVLKLHYTIHTKDTELIPKLFRFSHFSTTSTEENSPNNSVRDSVIPCSRYSTRRINSRSNSVR